MEELSESWQLEEARMLAWLTALEEDPPSADVLEGIVKKLAEENIRRPADLVGADENDVANLWQTVGTRAFLRRAVRTAEKAIGGPAPPQRAASAQNEAGIETATSAARVAEAFWELPASAACRQAAG